MATKSKSLSMLAKEQALKDIKEELSKSGKSFITVSMRQLKLRRFNSCTVEDIYCRVNWLNSRCFKSYEI